jgi:ABC-type transport system involved in multi-copper enzyme maturation permease subunit
MKVTAIIKKVTDDSKSGMIAFIVIALVFGTLSVVFFPAVKQSGIDLAQIMKSIPPELTKALGIANTNLAEFNNYIATRYLGVFGLVAFAPFVLSWAGRIAQDAEAGTLALILAYPVTRSQVFLAHYSALLVKTGYLVLIVLLSVLLPAVLIGESFSLVNWLIYALILFVFLGAIGSVTILAAVLLQSKSKAMAAGGAFLAAGYFTQLFSQLVPQLADLKYFSLMYYYGEPASILRDGSINATSLLLLLLIAALGFVSALIIFRRKDLPAG